MFSGSQNPLTAVVLQGSVPQLRAQLAKRSNKKFLNKTDSVGGPHKCTQLIHCSFRDDATATAMATLLIDAGADPSKPDDGPGSTPCFMAAQNGLPQYLGMLIGRGADPTALALRDAANTTTCLYIAAQNGCPQCCAVLLADGRAPVDRANRVGGRSPLYKAMEQSQASLAGPDRRNPYEAPRSAKQRFRDYCAVVGALLRGGAAAARGTHHLATAALNRLVESCSGGQCTRCRVVTATKRCGRCKLARYCSAGCQRADWALHKKVCKGVARGVDALDALHAEAKGDAKRETLISIRAVMAREHASEEEGKLARTWHAWPPAVAVRDRDTGDHEGYDRATHAKWEHFDAAKGTWHRYDARVEAELEEMIASGAPYFMWRPGAGQSADGKFENGQMAATGPPLGVATRVVQFNETTADKKGPPAIEADSTEYDTYSGASRPVRRVGAPVEYWSVNMDELLGGAGVDLPAGEAPAGFAELMASLGR